MNRTKKLLIVESPAKIKTISKFLGKDFKIMSTFGHIKDLPPKEIGVTIDEKNHSIDLEYVPIEGKAGVIADICKQAGGASEVYLASDPDREGEIIAWHIGEEIKKVMKDSSHIYRITFNEITEPAVNDAIEHKGTIDDDKVKAQQARRVLDRWVGYEVSPILWKKITKGLSAGRVQSVALLLVCKREEEIVNFKPEESWTVHGLFVMKETDVSAELVKIGAKKPQLKNREAADKVIAEVKKESFEIEKITEKERLKAPLPPFMTSTLQQDAYNKLGFSVDRTMSIAQKLYEGVPLASGEPEALITYMRTDSLRISDIALKATRSFISEKFGKEYLPGRSNIYAKKGAQDAHEAIRPINVALTPKMAAQYLEPSAAKLYGLIWRRFVACQMTKAKYFQRRVDLKGGKYVFKVTGSTLIFDGFLKVYVVEDAESKKVITIPKGIAQGDPTDLKKVEGKQHFTQPPPRYTEASLVKEMEKKGVGRPSTYAATLFTIQKRKYVEKDPKKKRFSPTELGKTVSALLVKNLPDIINVSFTAKMELDLDKIANGDVERDVVLNDFYKEFQKDLVEFAGKDGGKEAVKAGLPCPDCKKDLLIRFGKSGQFIGCSGYPECTFTSNFTRDEAGNIKLAKQEGTKVSMELSCPSCGKLLVQKMSKYGPFWACPGYPECKYIHQEKLKTPCPLCKGELVKRKWRGGSFWGCSGYPKCKYAVFGEVKEEPCPSCGSPLLLVKRDKDGNEHLSCPNKECDYKA